MDEVLCGHLPDYELLLPLKGVPKSWTRSRVYRGKQIVRSGRIFCTKRIESAEVVDPETPRAGKAATRAFFGATVRYANAAATKRVVSIVGTDEVDLNRNHISWVSPLGRALMKSAAGDRIVLQAYLTVLEVCYERVSVEPFREPPGAEASAKGLPRGANPPDESEAAHEHSRPRARTNCELTQGLFVPLLFESQSGTLACNGAVFSDCSERIVGKQEVIETRLHGLVTGSRPGSGQLPVCPSLVNTTWK